ncbi:LysR substrate-binding domain-containing protein [Motilimonas sp. KMU-193]|uniref:LysR substrate-binding domain-containing protein n=1 Tax=Motilimonas sp. KMU-193 TaxID=3388668 RepID=UPI00396B23C0
MQLQLRNLDLNLLTLFVAVMEQQNVSKAARVLNMSQPAMSLGLNRLRKKFNDDLFYRSGGIMQPTALAKSLYQPINEALKTIGQALPQDDLAASQIILKFNLAMPSALEPILLTSVLSQLSQSSPNVRINSQQKMDIDALKYNRLDFILDTQPYQGEDLYSEKICSETLILAYSCVHPRINHGADLATILNESFAVVEPQRCLTNKDKVKVDYKLTSYQAALSLAAQTQVLTLVPKSSLDNSDAKRLLNWQPSPFSKKQLDIYLTWLAQREQDKSHQWLKDCITDSLAPNKLSAISA